MKESPTVCPPAPPVASGTASPRVPARGVAVLLVLGVVLYSAWLLEFVLSTGLPPTHTYLSELAAGNQPYGRLFRTTDLVSGVLLFAAGAWALLGRQGPRGPWAVTGWVGIALFGAATVADSRLPMSCTPTVDPQCAQRERAGLVPVTHEAHAFSSSIAIGGALIAIVALTVAARRYETWGPLARMGRTLVVAELAATVWTLAAVFAFEAGRGTWGLGVAQRAQVALVAVWTGVLALSLVRRDR